MRKKSEPELPDSLFFNFDNTLFENQLSELVEAAAPGVPLVGSTFGYVTYSLHSHISIILLSQEHN